MKIGFLFPGQGAQTTGMCKDLYDKFEVITPVPGGVGIMTVLNVIKNIIRCYKLQTGNK